MISKETIKKLFLYGIVGATAATVELLVFYFLNNQEVLPLLLTNAVAFFCGFLVSFVGQRSVTFKKNSYTLGKNRQLIRYFVLAMINLFISTVSIALLVSLGVSDTIAKIISIIIVAIIGFIVSQRVIFH
jgi:putative flippase GtrA